MNKHNKYHPPVITGMTTVPLDPLLLTESSTMDQLYTIKGQSMDGYYEDGDLQTDWGWD